MSGFYQDDGKPGNSQLNAFSVDIFVGTHLVALIAVLAGGVFYILFFAGGRRVDRLCAITFLDGNVKQTDVKIICNLYSNTPQYG
ncbi:hypothetical protein LJC56_09860 [Christensenellaceae bacterium OttesenSCG-928-K19]|nr:hypothetical protein [Christensenellaceae bacterium OttesenSCG-928-K19]